MASILAKIEDLGLGLRNLVSRGSSVSGTESSPEPDALQIQTAKFEEQKLSDYVYALLPEANPEAVVVFFHGLLLDESQQKHAFWSTWTMRNNNDCWPITLLPRYLKTLSKKTRLDPYRIRVLAVSYEGRAQIPGIRIDDYLTAESFIQELVLTDSCRGQDDRDVPIFLVGHDLGGILIKKFIMAVHSQAGMEDEGSYEKEQRDRFLLNLNTVMFYATPHSGSQAIEDKARDIPADTRNPMLKLMSVLGADMARINGDFTRYRAGKRFKTYAVVPVCETNQKGFRRVMVVEEGSARNDVDEYYSVNGDHFQACQLEYMSSNSMINLGRKIHEGISGRLTQETERNFESLRNRPPVVNHGQASSNGMPRLRQAIPELADPIRDPLLGSLSLWNGIIEEKGINQVIPIEINLLKKFLKVVSACVQCTGFKGVKLSVKSYVLSPDLPVCKNISRENVYKCLEVL